MVSSGPEKGGRNDLAHHKNCCQNKEHQNHGLALVLGKGKVILQPDSLVSSVHTQNDHKYQNVYQQQDKNKAVKLGIVQVDGGQRNIEPHSANDKRNQQAD